jgi:hypothetical protein
MIRTRNLTGNDVYSNHEGALNHRLETEDDVQEELDVRAELLDAGLLINSAVVQCSTAVDVPSPSKIVSLVSFVSDGNATGNVPVDLVAGLPVYSTVVQSSTADVVAVLRRRKRKARRRRVLLVLLLPTQQAWWLLRLELCRRSFTVAISILLMVANLVIANSTIRILNVHHQKQLKCRNTLLSMDARHLWGLRRIANDGGPWGSPQGMWERMHRAKMDRGECIFHLEHMLRF